jgi:hypothetical protein
VRAALRVCRSACFLRAADCAMESGDRAKIADLRSTVHFWRNLTNAFGTRNPYGLVSIVRLASTMDNGEDIGAGGKPSDAPVLN